MRMFLTWSSSFCFLTLCSLKAQELTLLRPALFTNGSHSLINMIDTNSLVRKGQGDAVIHFTCYVGKNGHGGMFTYLSTPHPIAPSG